MGPVIVEGSESSPVDVGMDMKEKTVRGLEAAERCILEDEELGVLAPTMPAAITPFTTTTNESSTLLRPGALTSDSADRPKSFGIFSSSSKKERITGSIPTSTSDSQTHKMSKPLSFGNLRRAVSGAVRPKALFVDVNKQAQAMPPPLKSAGALSEGATGRREYPATASGRAAPPSAWGAGGGRTTGTGPRVVRAAVAPTIHSHGTIADHIGGVEDEESRRLSEMAFLN